ncbi:hypothetical protein [Pseudonocardia acaciae]|uniref:hypothetical protein n=1 Tax=Pseudonocardia acaciae TaxID=551276 RepID=UPI00048A9E10|nr:hypothetical protein [Pseudonocardia acaciae]
MAPIVAQLGPVRALGWFVRNMPKYERTLKALGETRTHLLCVGISLINGCPYCTYGHAYAFELAHLAEYGRLFPLDEQAISAMVGLPPAQVRHQLVKATQAAGLHLDALWLDRTITLATSADHRPAEPNEERIAHLVTMFGTLNRVGRTSGAEPDEAHSPLNKNVALKLRYAVMRASATS